MIISSLFYTKLRVFLKKGSGAKTLDTLQLIFNTWTYYYQSKRVCISMEKTGRIQVESEIIIPKSFSDNKQETIKVFLTQAGKKVEDADFVHFEIWKQDGSLKNNMEEAEEKGSGVYSLNKNFDSDGLYYIKVHAGNDGSIIMPQKQYCRGTF
jgi:hypothetical protein